MKFFFDLYNKCTQPIDFDGQKLATQILYALFIGGFTISYFLGIFLNDLKFTLFGGIATLIITFFIVVPPWPMYRRKNMKFSKKAKSK